MARQIRVEKWQEERIRELWGKGLSRRVIIERMGLSRGKVDRVLRRIEGYGKK